MAVQTIDFLPLRYREQAMHRRKQVWRVAVIVMFGAVVAATGVFQFSTARGVRRQVAEIEPQHTIATQTNEKLLQLQNVLASMRAVAGLYAYLDHPWPRSQMLAVLAEPLPSTLNLSEIRIELEQTSQGGPVGPQLSAAATPNPEQTAEETLSPAQKDLKLIRERRDRATTIVKVSGVTTDTTDLHKYVAALGQSKLFAKAELGSLESLGPGQTGAGSRFDLRLVVRAGYGQPGGPKTDEPRTASLP